MTSEGGGKAVPEYGPVCAAKAILEAHIRQLALELAPLGITANAIMAGVTDTPAAAQDSREREADAVRDSAQSASPVDDDGRCGALHRRAVP